ncbi:MAG: type II toxin-antitoxin system HipA family toxin [Candidatus Dadabacteria bacterium]|nr:type II toxin-antitoxin system HipA family toxin [Candidatus Dadabacteria bacterium]
MNYSPVSEITVSLDFGRDPLRVGTLARSAQGGIYFEYAPMFPRSLNISPLRLPHKPGLIAFDPGLFEGLPGVFYDSLPDGWGRLLLDRFARSKGVEPGRLTPLDRLAHVGRGGMGALVYEPDLGRRKHSGALDIDDLALKTRQVLGGSAEDVLEELVALNGSSAGARPKAMISVSQTGSHVVYCEDGETRGGYAPWLVKFPNAQDGSDAGAIEYVYSLMAREAGVLMSETHLFPASNAAGYFAARRFDRAESEGGTTRLHVHTAGGLLHSDFRIPSLDYQDLLALTEIMTRDMREVEKMYRHAVFNVMSHNRDDHAKNFSFIMDSESEWKLSPAYDITFSSGPGGQQSTTVLGEGRNPASAHLRSLGQKAKLNDKTVENIIERTRRALSEWKALARGHGVSRSNIKLIGDALGQLSRR